MQSVTKVTVTIFKSAKAYIGGSTRLLIYPQTQPQLNDSNHGPVPKDLLFQISFWCISQVTTPPVTRLLPSRGDSRQPGQSEVAIKLPPMSRLREAICSCCCFSSTIISCCWVSSRCPSFAMVSSFALDFCSNDLDCSLNS